MGHAIGHALDLRAGDVARLVLVRFDKAGGVADRAGGLVHAGALGERYGDLSLYPVPHLQQSHVYSLAPSPNADRCRQRLHHLHIRHAAEHRVDRRRR